MLTACASCGIVFGMPADLNRRRREDGKDFFCPNGHINVYKGEVADLKKQIEAANAQVATANRLRTSAEQMFNKEKEAHTLTQKKLAASQVKPVVDTTPKPIGIDGVTLKDKVLTLLGDGSKWHYSDLAKELGTRGCSISPIMSHLYAKKMVERTSSGVYRLTPKKASEVQKEVQVANPPA